MYSANAAEGTKKNQWLLELRDGGNYARPSTGSDVSIADALEIVKEHFASGLSKDAQKRLKVENAEGIFKGKTKC